MNVLAAAAVPHCGRHRGGVPDQALARVHALRQVQLRLGRLQARAGAGQQQ